MFFFDIVNYRSFCLLPDEDRDKLLELLPDSDRTSPEVLQDLLNFDPFFQNAIHNYQLRLSAGEFDPEVLLSTRSRSRSAQPPVDTWKQKFFEEFHGQSLGHHALNRQHEQTSSSSTPLFTFTRARRENALISSDGCDLSAPSHISPNPQAKS